ncbi:MAG: sigma-70 family RNA polymerase sigma factor, partial [Jatrophihabitantaceae bacterium]
MPGDVDHEDSAVLMLLRAGDEASFAALVTAWSPAMISMAQRFVPSREAAEDVVQDTWLAVVDGIDRFQGRSTLRTWVLSILIRQAQRTGRRERRTIPFSVAWRDEHGPSVAASRFRAANAAEYPRGWVSPLPRWDLLPDNHLQARELRRVLADAISDLPRRQQQVIMARDVWGCGSSEVCTMLGLSANYQRVLLHRARAHL